MCLRIIVIIGIQKLLMKNEANSTRWKPYADWVHCISEKKFKKGRFEYDFTNPPQNKTTYLETRETLIKEITEFLEDVKIKDVSVEQCKRTSYTKEEAKAWQNELMRDTLEKWFFENRKLVKRQEELEKQLEECHKIIKQMDNGAELLKDFENKNKNKNRWYKVGNVLYPGILKVSEKLHIEGSIMKIVKKMKQKI